MRNIESEMIAAIGSGKDWRHGNTSVTFPSKHTVATRYNAEVRLYGHLIAEYCDETAQWRVNLCGRNTVTTRSRLSAILREFVPGCCGICTKQEQASIVYGDGRRDDIANTLWYDVPRS